MGNALPPSLSGYVPVWRVPSQRAACLHGGAVAASDAPVPLRIRDPRSGLRIGLRESAQARIRYGYQRSADRATTNISSPWFVNLLRYESLLNQAFHRDLILLHTLQKAHSTASALSPRKPPQSERSLIEAQADSVVVNQAVGSPAVTKPSPVANEDDVKQDEEDPDRPGYFDPE